MRARSRWPITFAIALAVGASPGLLHCADWLQFGGDPAHRGSNAVETGYSTAGNRLAFSPVVLPSKADVAPVFVGAVATPGGLRDLLFIVTRDGSLLALDAADGSVLWSRAQPGSGTLTTSAPAVDAVRQFVYACGLDGKVHKYTVADGNEYLLDGWPQVVTLKPDIDKVASALAIATAADASTHLYAVTDSYLDTGDFQGHLTAINLATGAQTVFNAQCSRSTKHFLENGSVDGSDPDDCASIPSPKEGQTANSGIWGRAGATFDAATNRVFVTTGNGLFDPTNAQGFGNDWGDSVLALDPDGGGSTTLAGAPLDSYTPATHGELFENDADLGSSSMAILPAPAGSVIAHLGLQGGKDACLRLLNLDQLSGVPGPGHAGGELQALSLPNVINHCLDGGSNGAFKTQPAVWTDPQSRSTWVFIAYAGGTAAYQLILDDAGNPSLSPRWWTTNSGTSPVVANATLYYASVGVVRAIDARTGNPIWSDAQLGNIHWQSPIVVNGRLYVIDQTSKLWVYQLDGIFRGSFSN